MNYYDLQMDDIVNFGSIGTEFNYNNKDKVYSTASHWTSIKSTGFVKNIDEMMVKEYSNIPERIQVNNMVYMQTGPYAKNSIYHPYLSSKETSNKYIVQVYDQIESKIKVGLGMFDNQENLRYSNYPSTFENDLSE